MTAFETEKYNDEKKFRKSLLKLLFQFWFLLYVFVLWSFNKYNATADLIRLKEDVMAFYKHEGYL